MSTAVFSNEQIAALSAPLDRAKVQTRSQAGRSLAYLEGWASIRFRDTVGEPGPRRGHAQQQTTNDHQHRQGTS
ncbi:MAG: RAD52 family DNA repair protein [Cyanobium usitatum Tobar12.5m-G36]|nr:RAD52 family DNA repair protein [Cyanobium usitatum Tobar12.5m-G36]